LVRSDGVVAAVEWGAALTWIAGLTRAREARADSSEL
jgi:hypothetical protein